MIKTYIQTTTKISYSNNKELIEKINRLGASSDMPFAIFSTVPDSTDTNQWCAVNYWVQK